MRRCAWTRLAGTCGLLLCPAVLAEAGPRVLAPVEAPAADIPSDDDSAPASQTRLDPTGALTVIPLQGRQSELKDVADVLSTAAGVFVQDTGGAGQARLVSVRGASSTGVLVLLDGVPLNGAGGVVDLSLLPPALLDRLELARGSGGASALSGALGGVVNLVTPRAQGTRVFEDVSAGSFDTAWVQAGASGNVLGGEALVTLSGQRSRGDFRYLYDPLPNLATNPLERRVRANNDSERGGLLLKYHHGWGNWDGDALVLLSAGDRGLAGTAANPTPGARESELRGVGQLAATYQAPAGTRVTVRGLGQGETTTFAGNPLLPDGAQHYLLAGGEVQVQQPLPLQALSASLQGGSESVTAPANAAHGWARFSAALVDELLLWHARLTVAPALRLDRVGPFWGFSPKLGARLLLTSSLTLRANVGRAFRAPSFLELYVLQGTEVPNPALRPEEALQGDLALEWNGPWGHASVGGFGASYENLILYEYYPPFLAKPYNFPGAVASGLEAEVSARWGRFLQGSAAYTLTFTQDLRDDARYFGKDLPYRPRHKLFARLVGGPAFLQGRVELDYQSQQFVNRTDTLFLPGRARVNVGVTAIVRDSPRVALSAEVRNLFDVQTQDFDGYPLPGRSFYLTLSLAWERT